MIFLLLRIKKMRSHRLSVRTHGFHPWKRGSIPLGTAIEKSFLIYSYINLNVRKFGQFINGKWLKSSGGETYDVVNPATEEIIGKASKANLKDIDLALKSAESGLKIWKIQPWERSKIIRKISELIKKRNDKLSKWLTLEVGKPINESLNEIAVLLKYLSGVLKKQKEFMVRLYKEIFRQQNTCLLSASWSCCSFSTLEFSYNISF